MCSKKIYIQKEAKFLDKYRLKVIDAPDPSLIMKKKKESCKRRVCVNMSMGLTLILILGITYFVCFVLREYTIIAAESRICPSQKYINASEDDFNTQIEKDFV